MADRNYRSKEKREKGFVELNKRKTVGIEYSFLTIWLYKCSVSPGLALGRF
jgi:hypothetical protein